MKPLRGHHKRAWSDGSLAGDRHDGGLKMLALDKPTENANPLTMECKDGSDTVCKVDCKLFIIDRSCFLYTFEVSR